MLETCWNVVFGGVHNWCWALVDAGVQLVGVFGGWKIGSLSSVQGGS